MARRVIILTLGALLFVGALLLIPAIRGRVRAQYPPSSSAANPFQVIDELAQRSESGDPKAVSDLAEEMFVPFGWANDPVIKPAVVERLVHAELDHRKGAARTMTEGQVVGAVNALATRFGAPPYAKTSQRQIRYIRVGLMVQMPHFIAVGRMSSGRDVEKMSPEMAPLEAAFVMMTLVHQKIYNEHYQFEPDEWDRSQYEGRLQRWRELMNAGGSPRQHRTELRAQKQSQKTEEMLQFLRTINTDKRAAADEVLDNLGVPRLGGRHDTKDVQPFLVIVSASRACGV